MFNFQQLLLYTIVPVALVAILIVRWKRQKLYNGAGTMNGPFALPLFGHLYFIFGKKPEDDLFKVLNRYAPFYNSPVGIWLGPFFVVGLHNNPDHIQTVLNSPHLLNKTFHYNFLRMNHGLLSSPGR
ncbi:AGAP002195-PB-like protein [Anopheles sinensis]|uniref:AGAP002195-PB-like protein n=1 Tax=Anopheles sinensis TaxID=74873 RepID=A0A084WP82_ANOSI|nr:AGAP002195-PB-like protein [Anopheles sinensis]